MSPSAPPAMPSSALLLPMHPQSTDEDTGALPSGYFHLGFRACCITYSKPHATHLALDQSIDAHLPGLRAAWPVPPNQRHAAGCCRPCCRLPQRGMELAGELQGVGWGLGFGFAVRVRVRVGVGIRSSGWGLEPAPHPQHRARQQLQPEEPLQPASPPALARGQTTPSPQQPAPPLQTIPTSTRRGVGEKAILQPTIAPSSGWCSASSCTTAWPQPTTWYVRLVLPSSPLHISQLVTASTRSRGWPPGMHTCGEWDSRVGWGWGRWAGRGGRACATGDGSLSGRRGVPGAAPGLLASCPRLHACVQPAAPCSRPLEHAAAAAAAVSRARIPGAGHLQMQRWYCCAVTPRDAPRLGQPQPPLTFCRLVRRWRVKLRSVTACCGSSTAMLVLTINPWAAPKTCRRGRRLGG